MSSETHFTNSSITATTTSSTSRISVVGSARQLLVFVSFVLIFMAASRTISDPDFWWHLKTGQILVETRSIPHTDLFSSFHSGREWITHEWLSEVFMYGVYTSLGYGGLIVIFSLIIAVAFFLVYRRYQQDVGHPYIACTALLLGAFATMPTWGVRPQMFSLLLASVFLAILDDFSRDHNKRTIYWLIPLTVLWANMHAGFALGLALILLTIVGLLLESWLTSTQFTNGFSRVRPLLLVWSLSLAAVVINPNGIRLYLYPFETLKSHAMMKYITEWWSPNFQEPMFQPLAVLIFATCAALALGRKQVRLRELVLLSATGIAALRSGRNVPFFALVAIPLLARHSWDWVSSQRWGQWLTRPEDQNMKQGAAVKIVLNIVLFVVMPLGLAATRISRSVADQTNFNRQGYPAAATDFVLSHRLPQPIYNEYGWGGYLIWRLYPDYRVYIDGRADVYGDAFLEEFLMVHGGEPRWQEPLQRYGIQTVMVKPDTALASLLKLDQGWAKVFEDPQAAIFIKK
jgi:hypothetical protein